MLKFEVACYCIVQTNNQVKRCYIRMFIFFYWVYFLKFQPILMMSFVVNIIVMINQIWVLEQDLRILYSYIRCSIWIIQWIFNNQINNFLFILYIKFQSHQLYCLVITVFCLINCRIQFLSFAEIESYIK